MGRMRRRNIKGGLKGINEVSKNLSKVYEDVKVKSRKGLIEVAILLQRETEPLIPVDTGNLRASWFAVVSGEGSVGEVRGFRNKKGSRKKIGTKMRNQHNATVAKMKAFADAKGLKGKYFLIVGFTANYAVIVHEKQDVTYQRPGASSKFLEKALLENKDEIMMLLQNKMKL